MTNMSCRLYILQPLSLWWVLTQYPLAHLHFEIGLKTSPKKTIPI